MVSSKAAAGDFKIFGIMAVPDNLHDIDVMEGHDNIDRSFVLSRLHTMATTVFGLILPFPSAPVPVRGHFPKKENSSE